jgi:ubiquitin C-terminal hydrolase
LADEVDGLTRDCPKCGPKQSVKKCYRIDAALEYMLVKFVPTYNTASPLPPNSKVARKLDMRKITAHTELSKIDAKINLTRRQVDTSTDLTYRLVAVLLHTDSVSHGHWIATVRNYPKWYNIDDGDAREVRKKFALSNPESVPHNWNATVDEKKKEKDKFQVVVLMCARVE